MAYTCTGIEVQEALSPTEETVDDPVKILAAINLAIADSWPVAKRTSYQASVATFASNTHEYTLTLDPTVRPHHQFGIARAFVLGDSLGPRRRIRHFWQDYDWDADTWTLIFPGHYAPTFVGKDLGVQFQYPHPQITDLEDTIMLSKPYLVAYVKTWIAENKLTPQTTDTSEWGPLHQEWSRDLKQALQMNWVQKIPVLMGEGKLTLTGG